MKLYKKIKYVFLDLISFGSPQAIVFNFSFILFILGILPTDKLSYLPIRSIWQEVFKIKLYSAGLTHALSRLLHLDFIGAWQYNKLVFVVFIVILVLLVINLIKSIKYYKKTGKVYSFR